MLNERFFKRYVNDNSLCVFDFRSVALTVGQDGFRLCYIGYLDTCSSVRRTPPIVHLSVCLCFEI